MYLAALGPILHCRASALIYFDTVSSFPAPAKAAGYVHNGQVVYALQVDLEAEVGTSKCLIARRAIAPMLIPLAWGLFLRLAYPPFARPRTVGSWNEALRENRQWTKQDWSC